MNSVSRFAVLLHGLGRSAFSMRPVQRRLAAHGYEVLNVGYPSTTATIPVLAAGVAARLATWHPARSIDFITHSLNFETGIIAGTRSYNPWFSAILGGPSDGKVRVDRAAVAGMRDFVTVPYWHPFLMRPANVHALMLRFLERGEFR